MPYYIGKAVTYALLALATYWLISFLPQVVLMKYIAFVVLVLVSCIFILLAINSSTHIGLEFRWLSNFTSVVMKRLGGGSQYGIRGFITGMVLGCIPCGMVMAALAQAVSGASSVIIVVLAMLAFGFGTIPGLLLLSFGGKQLRHGLSKKMFSVLYSIMMLYNGLMLLNYALNLIR
jgi:sulfite exporter TauE/SafE